MYEWIHIRDAVARSPLTFIPPPQSNRFPQTTFPLPNISPSPHPQGEEFPPPTPGSIDYISQEAVFAIKTVISHTHKMKGVT